MAAKKSRDDGLESKRPALAPHPLLAEAHQPVLRPLLKQWLAQDRTPPVLLLTGVAGSGVRDAALFLALSLLCERRRDHAGVACGQCPSCLRHQKGQWVDFTEIAPEDAESDSDPEGGGSSGRSQGLKIAQFESILTTQGFGALQGDYRVILISQAERMNAKVANALLKILEEPPRGWIFLLAAADESLVLPTLRSRCQRLRLRPLPADVVAAVLREEDVPEARIAPATEAAQGNLELARLLTQDEYAERWKNLQAFFQSPRRHLNELVDWAAKDARHFDFLLTGLELQAARTWSRQPQESFWGPYSDQLAETRKRSLAPLNRKLLIQNVLMPWLDRG